MQDLAKKDDAHCLEIRAITRYGDSGVCPSVYVKLKEEKRIIESDELWTKAVSVTETEENWRGELNFSLQLPSTPEIPACIKKAFREIAFRYCDRNEEMFKDFFELYVEEYEGGWTGGAGEDCSIQGKQLPDFLNRMQALSDMVREKGGTWEVDGWMFSDDFGILYISTDKQGKEKAEYLKL